jgi:hypothetical protein
MLPNIDGTFIGVEIHNPYRALALLDCHSSTDNWWDWIVLGVTQSFK